MFIYKVYNLLEQIKPIGLKEVSDCIFELRYLAPKDTIKQSFSFSSEYGELAKGLYHMTQAEGLTSSYPGIFKPSMKEVFAFIQHYHRIDEVKAIRVEFAGHHSSGDGNRMMIYLYGLIG